jgi:hypothetical protein
VRRTTALGAGVLALTMIVGLTTGCGAKAQATPTPTKTPRPVQAAATLAPTPTSVPALPTIAPSPTSTMVPPTATSDPTDAPSATPPPDAGAQAASPTAQSQSGGSAGASAEPLPRVPGVSIFTGLRPADPAVLDRRPLAVKIANQASVIPQSGLSKADVVVESRVEFCESRYTAIYQSQDAPRIGSIRSARLVDVELPVIFDAILAFSGGVEPVRQRLYKSDFGDRVLEQARNGSSFFRDPNINVPDNLFANTATLWKTATARGWNKAPDGASAAWVFSDGAPEGGKPATRLDVPYPRFKVAWTYDPEIGRWKRTLRGAPHLEKTDGSQLAAANVVVLTANHVQTLIPEHGTTLTSGPCSNRSIEIQLWGKGPAKVLRDGKVYEGFWVRPDRHSPFRIVDASGKDIPLKPGNSWWQVVAPELKVTAS